MRQTQTAGAPSWVTPLQALIENPLPRIDRPGFIGLIGDHPSTYARSPRMWNPALAAFDVPAGYLPLDVRADRLGALLSLLARTELCLGANVTTPYKEAVLPLLEPDPVASALGAVNTIVRLFDGRLVGANTDGAGLISALQYDNGHGAFLKRLDGLTILLIGAGGAGRAAALALAPLVKTGELFIINRTHDRAVSLAHRVRAAGGRATPVRDAELDDRLPSITLVINASLSGQAGTRKSRDGWTTLEHYSSLAPVREVMLPPMAETEFSSAWERLSAADVAANHERSRARVRRLPADAVVFDMIYAPRETPLLEHARAAGLRTANGRWMNIAQAAAAFVEHICAAAVSRSAPGDPTAARTTVERIMAAAWDG